MENTTAKKLKILLVLIEPPLPFGNAGSRWFHVLRQQLRQSGHHVHTLVTSGVPADLQKAKDRFTDGDMELFPFQKARGFWDKIKNFSKPHSYKFSDEFHKAYEKALLHDFDIIHVEQTWGGWVSWKQPKKTLLNVHYLQSIDLGQVTPKSFKEKILFQRYFATEKKILSHYPFVRTCTPRLEKRIQKWGKKSFVETVPFGIDSSLYPYISDQERSTENMTVSLIGNMGWYPSVSAAERLITGVWPFIKKELPKARCQIVGWKAREALKDYLHLQDIEILENVPDIQPYFNNAGVLVYPPQRGSGMKIKVQEAFCYGIPVVTTAEGVEGLPVKNGTHCYVAEDDQELAQYAVKVLQDHDKAQSLRKSARHLVETHCSPKDTVNQILKLYAQILDQAQ